MKPAPISKQHPKVTQRTVGEKGYVLVLVALMILPLVGFTGFAVDLGSWYGRAAQIQRASDASALAGVQKLPNLPAAIAAAKSVAAQNGFVDGVDGITVTVVQVPDINAKLSVTIQDSKAAQYFTNMFRSNVTIKRTGTAQFLKPLQMGSPKNFLGTGTRYMQGGSSGSCGSNTSGKCFRENFWLAVNGRCTAKEQGDRILSIGDGRLDSCSSGADVNTEYDPNGYFYAIEFGQNMTGTYKVQVFDYGHCGSTAGDTNTNSSSFETTFQMRDNSSLDPRATAPIPGAKLVGKRGLSGSACGNWTTLGTLVSPTKGTYFVQVTSAGGPGNSDNYATVNGFSLRAFAGTNFSACTSTLSEAVTGAVTYNAGCPNVYGYGAMGVKAAASQSPADFYLTQIQGHDYDNKKLELELWDPGEGARGIQIVDPTGSTVPFEWEVVCYNGLPAPCSDGTAAPYGGWSGSSSAIDGVGADALDIAGTKTSSNDGSHNDPQPFAGRTSTWKYSDRLVKLTIQLPADVPAAYGNLSWFRIRYTTFGSGVTDRTTWSASIQGAPVRLIPNP